MQSWGLKCKGETNQEMFTYSSNSSSFHFVGTHAVLQVLTRQQPREARQRISGARDTSGFSDVKEVKQLLFCFVCQLP